MEGVDLLRGMETNGVETVVASGGDPIPGSESTGVEGLGVIAEVVDYLVDEFGWDIGRHWWWKREIECVRAGIDPLFILGSRSTVPKRQQRSTLQARETHRQENTTLVSVMAMFIIILLSAILYAAHVSADLYVRPLSPPAGSHPGLTRF